jgi:hypothetical protein
MFYPRQKATQPDRADRRWNHNPLILNLLLMIITLSAGALSPAFWALSALAQQGRLGALEDPSSIQRAISEAGRAVPPPVSPSEAGSGDAEAGGSEAGGSEAGGSEADGSEAGSSGAAPVEPPAPVIPVQRPRNVPATIPPPAQMSPTLLCPPFNLVMPRQEFWGKPIRLRPIAVTTSFLSLKDAKGSRSC